MNGIRQQDNCKHLATPEIVTTRKKKTTMKMSQRNPENKVT